MRILEFDVNRQMISKNKNCDFSHIVSGTEGYLFTKFNFSKDWNGCNKAASFFHNDKEFAVPLVNDQCEIPEEVLVYSNFKLSVTGMRPGYKLKTNKIRVEQEE